MSRDNGRQHTAAMAGIALSILTQDVRLALRVARRAPFFTAAVLSTIALGVGATTAIFSAVRAVLIEPLPFADGGRIVSLWGTNPDKSVPRYGVSYADFRDWQQRTHSFDGMALYVGNVTTLVTAQGPESVADLYTSSNFLDVLGVKPIIGHAFGPEDVRGEESRSVILSYGYWQRRFAGARSVLGQTFEVAGRPRTVIGILPPAAQLLGPAFVGAPIDVMTVLEPSSYPSIERHAQHLFGAIGRLKRGTSLEQARTDLYRTAVQIADENAEIAGWTASVFYLTDDLSLDTKAPLLILLGASLLLLVIACINVANLLLVRGAGRSREIAVRKALGASRGRVLLQFIVESFVLGVSGGALGLALAVGAVHAIRGMLPFGVIARADDIGVSGSVLAFAVGVSLAAALAFGVWPALRSASSARLDSELRDRTRGSAGSGARRTLVVAELSLALVLVVCAALVWESVHRMLTVDPGFSTDGVVTASITLGKDYPDSAAVPFYRGLLTDLAARPGIDAAGATDTPPLGGGGGIFTSIRLIGQPPRPPDQPLMSTIRSITPGYFRALGMRVLAGRDLEWDEPTASMLVSKTAASAFWPGQSPLDKQIAFNTQPKTYPVIGEVNDTRQVSLAKAPAPIVYASMRRYVRVFHTMTLVVRGRRGVAATVATIRSALHAADPRLSLYDARTLQSIVDQSTAQSRLNIVLLGAFAVVALVLATLGIYGVVSYSVAQRGQEIGIRMALGARPADIAQMVLREGSVLAVVGVGIGIAAGLLATRLIRTMLFDVGPSNPVAFAAVAALLIGVALVAIYIPARRAARVDPVRAMRAE